MTKLLTLVLMCFFCFSSVNAEVKVIYGDDNRKDVYEVTNQLFLDLAKSTAAMIGSGSIQSSRDPNMVKIVGRKFEDRGFCADEPYSQQISAAMCSGFLVAPDMLVTAGHCVRYESDCKNYRWVFGFKVDSAEQMEHETLKENVYSCAEIVERKLDRSNMDDYALLRLDRPVVGRTPLDVRTQGEVQKDDPLVVIGHPAGLPTKIADGANVRSTSPDKYFVANLDTYGGNSGSAVFNSDSGVVEGILVRGETDYVYRNGCRVSNVCTNDGCRGEDVTRITNIKSLKNLN